MDENVRKRRATHFSEDELRTLLNEVSRNIFFLFIRKQNKITLKRKNEAWERIAQAVSAMGVARRTIHQVRTKWRDLRREVLFKNNNATPNPHTETVLRILNRSKQVRPDVVHVGRSTPLQSADPSRTGLASDTPNEGMNLSTFVKQERETEIEESSTPAYDIESDFNSILQEMAVKARGDLQITQSQDQQMRISPQESDQEDAEERHIDDCSEDAEENEMDRVSSSVISPQGKFISNLHRKLRPTWFMDPTTTSDVESDYEKNELMKKWFQSEIELNKVKTIKIELEILKLRNELGVQEDKKADTV